MAKIVLDLHDIYDKGFTIDAELNRVIHEAIEKKIALVELIPGKGSGQLKKRVLRCLSLLYLMYSIISSFFTKFGYSYPFEFGRFTIVLD